MSYLYLLALAHFQIWNLDQYTVADLRFRDLIASGELF